ncbi:hypothetical protein GGD83_003333 [Rhodoblastus sphagnicola]|uniref:hypothetical protein n=1 Tax=Rhodoblastus sphagnicola TaxID=333368 RepID=UPI001304E2FD|nr:hypothetical protein [Rhodoblastus sphagnicola]MBB4199517.1 hypothetical protein [Rhodoblastus sphagnicola]
MIGASVAGVSWDDVEAVAADLPERHGDGAYPEAERIDPSDDGAGFTTPSLISFVSLGI